MNINRNLTESDLDKIDVNSPLEHQIQQREMKNSGWKLDKINSMIICFYNTDEINGQSYVKIPVRSNAILNTEKYHKNCFLRSILAKLHPCNKNYLDMVSN